LHGFVSHLLRVPQENFTVAVLGNCAPPFPGLNPGALAQEIAEFYLAEKLAPREAPKVADTISTDDLEAIVGRYDYGAAVLTVRRRGDQVFAQLTGQREFEIYPKSETNYFWKVVEAEVTFVKDEKGRVRKAIHRQGGQALDAPRLEEVQAAKVTTEILDAIVGRYDYGGGKIIMTVSRVGERLFAELTGQPKFEIVPQSETEFVWKDLNAQVTFVKDEKGKVIKAIHHQAGRKFDAPRLQ
jgi:hypothetical protein